MATTAQTWSEEIVEAAGGPVQLAKGGQGDPLLIFPDEIGDRTWLNYHQQLAQDYNLVLPSYSGFGATKRREWILGIRDLAGWYLELMDDLGLGQVNAIGFSMGGWLAAEIASMYPQAFKKLVLVGPLGIRPPTGEIYDMFLVTAKQFIAEGFLDPESVPEFATLCPRRADSGAGRRLGGRQGRGKQDGLEALYAQSQPSQPASPGQVPADPACVGTAGRRCAFERKPGLSGVH